MGFCRATMVNAAHSSSCGFSDEGIANYGGAAAGWVLRLDNRVCVYHAGDTDVFSDMAIIDDLYRPRYLLLPIGGNFTMGPEQAAYAWHKFFHYAKCVIPMHYLTFPLLKGDVPELKAQMLNWDEHKTKVATVIDSYADLLG